MGESMIDPAAEPAFVDEIVRSLRAGYVAAHDGITRNMSSGHYTAEGERAAWEAAAARGRWADVREAVKSWVAQHPRSAAEASAEVRRKLASPPAEAMDRLIFELNASRVWARAKAQLDRGETEVATLVAAGNMLENASPEDVPILLQELQPYLASRGVDDVGDTFDRALRKVAPEYAAASDAEQRAGEAARIVEANLYQVTRAMDSREVPDHLRDESFLHSVDELPTE